jgi:hypothetical protein
LVVQVLLCEGNSGVCKHLELRLKKQLISFLYIENADVALAWTRVFLPFAKLRKYYISEHATER